MRKSRSRADHPSNKHSLSCLGHTMAKSVGLSFEKIPKAPALLLDYLYHPEKVRPFFPAFPAVSSSDRPNLMAPGLAWPIARPWWNA